MHKTNLLTEDEDGDDNGKDDAQLVDRSDLRDRSFLECHEVKQPRERPRDPAQGDKEQRFLIRKHLRQIGDVSLCDYDAHEEHRHDRGAHRRRCAAVKACEPDLAEDGDECRTKCREQCIDQPCTHRRPSSLKETRINPAAQALRIR